MNSTDNTFYITDFDRTLVDSDKLLEVFIEITEEHFAIPREQIEKADRDIKQRGDSFDTAGYVRDHLAEEGKSEEWDALEKQFIHECRSLNMLLPGAKELLDWYAANGKRYGILTYGNHLWQGIKLTAAGFNHVDHIIMDYKEKGRLIKHWRLEDGTFRMPHEFGGGIVDKIILLDDKAVSFSEFPNSPSEGYWVVDQTKALPSQSGEVPSNVYNMNNLFEVVEKLNMNS